MADSPPFLIIGEPVNRVDSGSDGSCLGSIEGYKQPVCAEFELLNL